MVTSTISVTEADHLADRGWGSASAASGAPAPPAADGTWAFFSSSHDLMSLLTTGNRSDSWINSSSTSECVVLHNANEYNFNRVQSFGEASRNLLDVRSSLLSDRSTCECNINRDMERVSLGSMILDGKLPRKRRNHRQHRDVTSEAMVTMLMSQGWIAELATCTRTLPLGHPPGRNGNTINIIHAEHEVTHKLQLREKSTGSLESEASQIQHSCPFVQNSLQR